MGFQWDILLLEAGFLAIFFAPLTILPKLAKEALPSPLVLWLFHWLLFRLMFSSGIVKLLSGDATWQNLTALNYHYETQPLPNFISWYMYQLPAWFQKASIVFMFATELIVPFLIFAPRRFRFIGGIILIIFQILIILTGNYCFFNLLTIALCILLFDDEVILKLLPVEMFRWDVSIANKCKLWSKWIITLITGLILILSGSQMLMMLGVQDNLLIPVIKLYRNLSPFHIVNGYGLFAVMTTERPEIVIEGSNDGKKWLAYEFKCKPGNVKKRPAFVAPHQPRLDWQMWFAALSNYQTNSWFVNFCVRLLQGSDDVLSLIKKNPFVNSPPKYIRALVYNYNFTDFATKNIKHTWWKRKFKGFYCPVLSLSTDQIE